MAWAVDVGGTDITSICQTIRWRPKLSRPSSCVVRYPGHLFSATTGVSELHLTNGGLLFSGPVWFQQIDGTEDSTYTELTAYDHLIYLAKRMCKTGLEYPDPPSPNPDHEPGPGNLADPTQVLLDYVTGPEILAAFIRATKDIDGSFPLNVGSVATGGVDLSATPTDWPMDIATLANLLLETGQLGIFLSPGYGSSTVNLTNAGEGVDRTGSVSVQYGTGSHNARNANKTSDMEEVINALWYLLGPKKPQYDQDISHWAGSITPTAANAGGDGQTPGGNPGTPWPPSLVSRWMSSRGTYGYMQMIEIHDSKEDEQAIRPLFETMFANEALLRAVPRTMAAVSPDRFSSGPSFYPGDLITVQSGGALGGGFSGAERVYEYEITIDADGVADYTDLATSPDQEG